MMKKNFTKKIILSLALVLTLVAFLLPTISKAQILNMPDDLNITHEFGQSSGLSESEPSALIAEIIKVVLSLLAVVFLILIIVSGVKWMTANGEEEQIKKAKATLINAVIGLLIIFAAYAITYFVFSNLPLNKFSNPQVV